MTDSVAFIKAAGYGSRMGEIGKNIPKVLWPVFEKTILELQIAYINKLGIKTIFINTHHKHDLIDEFIRDKKLNINILFEEELLDSGGCLHNLKKHTKASKALVVNGDQFFYSNDLNDWNSKTNNTLYGLEVEGDYNEMLVEEGKLVGIDKNSKKKKYYTFSGVSLINLEKINYSEGPSKFFDTVANFQEISVDVSLGDSTYYDFGTLERYYESHKRVVNNIKQNLKDPFLSLLLEDSALDLNKLHKNSYDSLVDDEYFLSDGFKIKKGKITLD